jgi:hypothetical protein
LAVLLRAKTELELQSRDHVSHIAHLSARIEKDEGALKACEEKKQALEVELEQCQRLLAKATLTSSQLEAACTSTKAAQACAEAEVARLQGSVELGAQARRELAELGFRERQVVGAAAAERMRETVDAVHGMAAEDCRSQAAELQVLQEQAVSVQTQALKLELEHLSAALVEATAAREVSDREAEELKAQLARAARALVAHAPPSVVKALANGDLAVPIA